MPVWGGRENRDRFPKWRHGKLPVQSQAFRFTVNENVLANDGASETDPGQLLRYPDAAIQIEALDDGSLAICIMFEKEDLISLYPGSPEISFNN